MVLIKRLKGNGFLKTKSGFLKINNRDLLELVVQYTVKQKNQKYQT